MSSEKKPPASSLIDFLRAREKQGKAIPLGRRAGRTIRASDIGAFLYCRRAWWYRRQGIQSENQAQMRTGTQMHEAHGRAVLTAGFIRTLGYGLLLLAFIFFTIHLTQLIINY